ncbi:MAG: glycoside hydrolase family 15 protein, partial [Variovorax sp.]
PVLLAAELVERKALDGIDVTDMVQRALAYVATHGPATDQDRWEEDAGINAFTVAVCIAALVCGAPCLPPSARPWALALADDWNARLEDWLLASGTDLARQYGVERYYVRSAPAPGADGKSRLGEALAIKNRLHDPGIPAADQVATDFLQLVRLGLRDAHDPLILATVRIIDGELKVDTPSGPCWHRYTGDGYGETDDGGPFLGFGRGRAWPLLTGERGHYELAAGNDPLPFLKAMNAMTGRSGMLPEQVWDTDPVEGTVLEPGRPSGSAMPLVWAHAEFIKLVASRALGRPFDRPRAVWDRYQGQRPEPDHAIWLPQCPFARIRRGQSLTLALPREARVHHGLDGWQRLADVDTEELGLSLHGVHFDAAALAGATSLDFTFFWKGAQSWEGRDFHVALD